MKKLYFFTIILFGLSQFQCKKINSCNADICSNSRITMQTVTNQQGVMGIYVNNIDRRWMINAFDDPGAGLKMTCIICGDIPDSFKVMSKRVVFSGELKDACGIIDGNNELKYYIITPSSLR